MFLPVRGDGPGDYSELAQLQYKLQRHNAVSLLRAAGAPDWLTTPVQNLIGNVNPKLTNLLNSWDNLRNAAAAMARGGNCGDPKGNRILQRINA